MNPPSALPIRKPLDGFSYMVMMGLCLIWGLQQVAIKASASEMTPMLQVGLRSLFAALLVAGTMVWRGESLSVRDGTAGSGVWVGLLFGAEFVLVALGLNFTTAGHMAVFLYTAPVFAALGLHFTVKEERLNRRQWSGVGLAFAGIVAAFSGSLFAPGGKDLLIGDALGILAGMAWAATTIVIRGSRLSEAPASKTLLYQLVGAAVLAVSFGWWRGDFQKVMLTPFLWSNLVFQTVIVAFGSYLFWFWLLRRYLASRLSVFSFLTPLFGITFGVLLLKEPLHPQFVVGALLVLAGIAVVNRR
ncbi:DMT family transporter [Verrucomicrobium sp. BvORR106]|uniref:DMT family transporter n=1 Tax=Verrucomicrobium sp. BvORR106 TaxID=1403819 RepID=UPI00057042D6|nr:DMT family transporter [Verrucomicrobium sp. BvORR106]